MSATAHVNIAPRTGRNEEELLPNGYDVVREEEGRAEDEGGGVRFHD